MSFNLYFDYFRFWQTKPADGQCRAASEQCFGSLAVEDPIIRHLNVKR